MVDESGDDELDLLDEFEESDDNGEGKKEDDVEEIDVSQLEELDQDELAILTQALTDADVKKILIRVRQSVDEGDRDRNEYLFKGAGDATALQVYLSEVAHYAMPNFEEQIKHAQAIERGQVASLLLAGRYPIQEAHDAKRELVRRLSKERRAMLYKIFDGVTAEKELEKTSLKERYNTNTQEN